MNNNGTQQNGEARKHFFLNTSKSSAPSVQHSATVHRKGADPSSSLHSSRYPIPALQGYRQWRSSLS